jgi:hypothetical protein
VGAALLLARSVGDEATLFEGRSERLSAGSTEVASPRRSPQ